MAGCDANQMASVQISEHGSLDTSYVPRHSRKIEHVQLAPKMDHGSSLAEESKEKVQRPPSLGPGGPIIKSYKKGDCGGESHLGDFMLPVRTGKSEKFDISTDKCLLVNDPDTDKVTGTIKIKCQGSGGLQVCIWKTLTDTLCQKEEPICLNIQAADTPAVATSGCVPVTEHPTENDSYMRFLGFPDDTEWPICLVPELTWTYWLMVAFGGVAGGLLVLMVVWYSCFEEGRAGQRYLGGKEQERAAERLYLKSQQEAGKGWQGPAW